MRSIPDWVAVTDHAYDQWHKRAPDNPGIGPRGAYLEGVPLAKPHGFTFDNVRWHPPTDMIAAADGNAIVTVVARTDASATARAAVKRARSQWAGLDDALARVDGGQPPDPPPAHQHRADGGETP